MNNVILEACKKTVRNDINCVLNYKAKWHCTM